MSEDWLELVTDVRLKEILKDSLNVWTIFRPEFRDFLVYIRACEGGNAIPRPEIDSAYLIWRPVKIDYQTYNYMRYDPPTVQWYDSSGTGTAASYSYRTYYTTGSSSYTFYND